MLLEICKYIYINLKINQPIQNSNGIRHGQNFKKSARRKLKTNLKVNQNLNLIN